MGWEDCPVVPLPGRTLWLPQKEKKRSCREEVIRKLKKGGEVGGFAKKGSPDIFLGNWIDGQFFHEGREKICSFPSFILSPLGLCKVGVKKHIDVIRLCARHCPPSRKKWKDKYKSRVNEMEEHVRDIDLTYACVYVCSM